MKNKPKGNSPFVYSTNPDYKPFSFEDEDEKAGEKLDPSQQKLRIWFERKGRGGKEASIVKGFSGNDEDLETLAKILKTKLGTGGAAKDGEIVIQGDHRTKMLELLLAAGYKQSKIAGS